MVNAVHTEEHRVQNVADNVDFEYIDDQCKDEDGCVLGMDNKEWSEVT